MRPFRFLLPLWLGLAVLAAPAASSAQVVVGVSIRVAPPPLPVYVQPPIPAAGYLWMPGYWAYGPAGYYWVPGTWVEPPAVGLLWTPGYWGWSNGLYVWHAGYWGPHIGFYGGVNYGFGYIGTGFVGGFWAHGVFNYNRAFANVGGVHVVTYNKTVVVNRVNISFNGGPHGLHARPTPQQEAFAREGHHGPTPLQEQHEHAAAGNHALLASVNHGRPAIAASRHPGVFEGHEVVAAHGANPPGHGGPPPHPQAHPGPAGEHHGNDHHEDHHDEHHD
jgi:WXXGXW repeat (2 copies)